MLFFFLLSLREWFLFWQVSMDRQDFLKGALSSKNIPEQFIESIHDTAFNEVEVSDSLEFRKNNS